MDDETLEQIHLKLAFLERANTELSDVVFRRNRISEVALIPGLPPNLAAVMAVFGHADQPLPFEPGERGNERITFEGNTIERCAVEALKVEYGRDVKLR